MSSGGGVPPVAAHTRGTAMFTAQTLTLLLVAAQGDTHSLQWKLKEGDVFYNKTSVAMDQTIEVAGMSIDQTITMKTVLKFKVKSVKAGATVVEMTYLENKIDAQGLPGANIGNKLKDVSFTATLNDKMEVTKLEGYDKFLDALSDGDEEQKKLMKTMMPETTIRQSLGQTFAIAPPKPVAVGDKWDRTDKMALGPLGNVETKMAFKLDGVKGDVATISMKGDLTFKPGDGGGAGLPFKVTKADLKAEKFTGTHQFDTKLGRLTSAKVEMEMAGTMTIEAAGMKVDAKLKQKMTTTGVVTEKNPIVD
jgi:hypothetical protein